MPSIPAVQADSRSTLVSFTEEHITQLIREAVQVQHHCKRARFHLSTEKDTKSSAAKTKSRVGILRR
eukprot:CAMPEP_0197264402 /NCGR_PEP_ID=MMETSP1432-20130617/1770_1 /TAXON_ID=44447 /ORGANISM="Pseudo-nitzschia delicatissima, Strain UNC1205" /LENGTH=66 /DNA_ID=CAMNT_0042729041 /DNA_START=32 /DNA_END=229 /DNA_ORIENTATION=+